MGIINFFRKLKNSTKKVVQKVNIKKSIPSDDLINTGPMFVYPAYHDPRVNVASKIAHAQLGQRFKTSDGTEYIYVKYSSPEISFPGTSVYVDQETYVAKVSGENDPVTGKIITTLRNNEFCVIKVVLPEIDKGGGGGTGIGFDYLIDTYEKASVIYKDISEVPQGLTYGSIGKVDFVFPTNPSFHIRGKAFLASFALEQITEKRVNVIKAFEGTPSDKAGVLVVSPDLEEYIKVYSGVCLAINSVDEVFKDQLAWVLTECNTMGSQDAVTKSLLTLQEMIMENPNHFSGHVITNLTDIMMIYTDETLYDMYKQECSYYLDTTITEGEHTLKVKARVVLKKYYGETITDENKSDYSNGYCLLDDSRGVKICKNDEAGTNKGKQAFDGVTYIFMNSTVNLEEGQYIFVITEIYNFAGGLTPSQQLSGFIDWFQNNQPVSSGVTSITGVDTLVKGDNAQTYKLTGDVFIEDMEGKDYPVNIDHNALILDASSLTYDYSGTHKNDGERQTIKQKIVNLENDLNLKVSDYDGIITKYSDICVSYQGTPGDDFPYKDGGKYLYVPEDSSVNVVWELCFRRYYGETIDAYNCYDYSNHYASLFSEDADDQYIVCYKDTYKEDNYYKVVDGSRCWEYDTISDNSLQQGDWCFIKLRCLNSTDNNSLVQQVNQFIEMIKNKDTGYVQTVNGIGIDPGTENVTLISSDINYASTGSDTVKSAIDTLSKVKIAKINLNSQSYETNTGIVTLPDYPTLPSPIAKSATVNGTNYPANDSTGVISLPDYPTLPSKIVNTVNTGTGSISLHSGLAMLHIKNGVIEINGTNLCMSEEDITYIGEAISARAVSASIGGGTPIVASDGNIDLPAYPAVPSNIVNTINNVAGDFHMGSGGHDWDVYNKSIEVNAENLYMDEDGTQTIAAAISSGGGAGAVKYINDTPPDDDGNYIFASGGAKIFNSGYISILEINATNLMMDDSSSSDSISGAITTLSNSVVKSINSVTGDIVFKTASANIPFTGNVMQLDGDQLQIGRVYGETINSAVKDARTTKMPNITCMPKYDNYTPGDRLKGFLSRSWILVADESPGFEIHLICGNSRMAEDFIRNFDLIQSIYDSYGITKTGVQSTYQIFIGKYNDGGFNSDHIEILFNYTNTSGVRNLFISFALIGSDGTVKKSVSDQYQSGSTANINLNISSIFYNYTTSDTVYRLDVISSPVITTTSAIAPQYFQNILSDIIDCVKVEVLYANPYY